MGKDIFQQAVVPQKPNILAQERISVYMPKASKNSPGIASFEDRDFNINNAHVTLKWPEDMKVEQLANPLINIGYIKVLGDEFENTGDEASVINPVTGVTYKSKTAEVKLKRTGRNAITRPDLIKVSTHDFDATLEESGEILHTIKVNDTFEEPALIQVDTHDFKRTDGIVQINWPIAHDGSGSDKSNGYGLVKIAPNSEHYLKYIDGMLGVDDEHLFGKAEGAQVRPTYGGTPASGFVNIDDYLDANNKAKRNDRGNVLLAITKDSVGLTNVENRTFASREYSEFGEGMQSHFTTEFGLKLDKTTWGSMFNDWTPPSSEERTPQLRFDKLVSMHNAQQEQIDTLLEIKSFLGYFEDLDALTSVYTAEKKLLGCSAYLFSTNSYWGIRRNGSAYEWYDTGIAEKKFADYVETDPKRLKPNGEASVGSSGMWVQSDHVHPTDLTRLAVSIYKPTNVSVYSQFADLPDDVQDFKFNMWNEDADGIYVPDIKVNIPYVRKAQGLHNYAGSHGTFKDSEASTLKIWAGSVVDYANEAAEIAPNSLIFVDDGENYTVDEFINAEDIYKAGLILDKADQFEQIVITDYTSAPTLVGKPLTLSVTTRTDGKKAYKLAEKAADTYTANRVIVSDANGALEASNIVPTSIIKSQMDLPSACLVIGAGGKTIRPAITTNGIIGRPIVSNGSGGVVMLAGAANDGSVAVINADGSLEPANIVEPNILVTSNDPDTVVLTSNRLLISGQNNTVTTYNTGTDNKMLVANGLGAVKQSTIVANKLLYTSAQGTPAAFAMSAGDAGKVVGVSSQGTPTLLTINAPTDLPVTTLTEAPTSANSVGTKLVKLDAAPETMYSGYLYLW